MKFNIGDKVKTIECFEDGYNHRPLGPITLGKIYEVQDPQKFYEQHSFYCDGDTVCIIDDEGKYDAWAQQFFELYTEKELDYIQIAKDVCGVG